MSRTLKGVATRVDTSRMRLALTIVVLFIPAASSIVVKVLWRHPPLRIPTHWNGTGPANGFSNSDVTWWLLFAATVAAGAVGVAIIVLGSDVMVIKRATALGVAGIAQRTALATWRVTSVP